MDRGFFLPELPCSLPVGYHPKAAQIEFASNGWVRRMMADCFRDEVDLLRFLRERDGLYGPMIAPYATERRTRDLADWYHYVGALDSLVSDQSRLGGSVDGVRTVFATVLANLDGEPGPGPDSPYAPAAKDLWQRISPSISGGQRQRLLDSVERSFRATATEVGARLADEVPDYETCLAVRFDSFGCEFMEVLTEYAVEADMTEIRPRLDEVHRHCRSQLIVINDILSWRREFAQDERFTTVRVLTDHEGLDLQEAIDRLCTLVEYHERAYIAARDAVLAGPLGSRSDVHAYLRGLDYLMSGSQKFEYLTPRYFGDGYVWDGATSGWISLDYPAVTRPTAAQPRFVHST